MLNFHFFAYAALGKGLSGGDRIFIELARRWSKRYLVKIYLWKEGFEICKTQELTKSAVKFETASMEPWWRLGFLINYLARIVLGIIKGFTLQLKNSNQTVVYSASEFWMDLFPALILKLRFPKIRWVAAWYQTAPNPLKGFSLSRKKRYRLNAFLYWLVQFPSKRIISKFPDFVIVNNEEEKNQFPILNKNKRVLVCLGAVDLEKIKRFQTINRNHKKIYDGVFQGRLHPQKGVLEMLDIWKKVVMKKPDAKLAIIGDGPLMNDLKLKIENLELKNNIKLFGYLFDGTKKYQIFSRSKIVLHPSFYDSGGMAAAEAMAFGLPGVCFDLPSLKSYYPKGMLKAKIADLEDFKGKIFKLLNDTNVYNKKTAESKKMIKQFWNWDIRAQQILKLLGN